MKTTKNIYLNKDLVIGNKYTIVKMEGFTPYSANFTLVDYSFRNFAQYEDCLRLEVKIKRHRSNDIIWIIPSDIVLIKEGWHNINVYNRELIEDTKNVTVNELHKINIEDFKNDKDTILCKQFGCGVCCKIAGQVNEEVETLTKDGSIEINIDNLLENDGVVFV